MFLQDNQEIFAQAQKYSSIKYALAIVDTFYLLALLIFFAGSGLSRRLAQAILSSGDNSLFILPAYLLIAGLAYYLAGLPLNLYRSYILEHKFRLSHQRICGWIADQFKSTLISFIVGLFLFSAFYYILKSAPQAWWLWGTLFWILFGLIFAKVFPLLVVPLFFKYKRLSDDNLRQSLLKLAQRMQVNILDVFEIDLSKKTLKANAAFVGWGATKRVILADTLKDKYSTDEIEVILAHEFSHYKLRHLFKLIAVNSFFIALCFYLIFKTSSFSLRVFGFSSLSDIAALPVICIYFLLFGILAKPLENYFRRRLEVQADRQALEVTGKKEAFISLMEKLSRQNLADIKPHPLIKFYFFDHPPTEERIALARTLYSPPYFNA